MDPVTLQGRTIASSWWGAHWNENLERYADFAYRLERGRSYVRNGMVLDLKIAAGQITAVVAGSRPKPYNIKVTIDPLDKGAWKTLVAKASGQIDSVSKLLEGEFPADMKEVFFAQTGGLFPTPKAIKFECSCPDWASMCKHVAATLYGVGARLDRQPAMFFELRGVKLDDLVGKAAEKAAKSLLEKAAAPKPSAVKGRRILDAAAVPSDLSAVFGVATDKIPEPAAPIETKPTDRKPSKKKSSRQVVSAKAKSRGKKKPGVGSLLTRKAPRNNRN